MTRVWSVMKSTRWASSFRSVRRLGEKGRREGMLMGEEGLAPKVSAQCQDKGEGTLMRSVKREAAGGNKEGGHTAALLAGGDEEGGGGTLLHSLQCRGGRAHEEVHKQVVHGAAVEALMEGEGKVHGRVCEAACG